MKHYWSAQTFEIIADQTTGGEPMASTITESRYISKSDICIGNGQINRDTLSVEVDRKEIRRRFGREIDVFLEHENTDGVSRGSRSDHTRHIMYCLWLLIKKRRTVTLDRITAVDLAYLKDELELRRENHPVSHIRTFAAFISHVTNKPPLIDLGSFGVKKGKGISGPGGTVATAEDIKTVDARYGPELDSFGASEISGGLAPQTVYNHRRLVCACIFILEKHGITVSGGVTVADFDLLKKEISAKTGKDHLTISLFSAFLTFHGNHGPATGGYSSIPRKVWTTEFLRGFRFPLELERYRSYLRNRNISESSIQIRISRVIVCGRVLDSLFGEISLSVIDTEMTEELETYIQKHVSQKLTRRYLQAFFDFAGYFGVPDFYTELLKRRRTHIIYNPENPEGLRFCAKLHE